MDTRPLPEINWDNLRPPYDWWDFFKDADRHAFRFDAAGFETLNAWWLSECSVLAYSNPGFVLDTFLRVGFRRVKYFNGATTQCFVASNDDFIVVVFRGTETNIRDEAPDFMDIVCDIFTDAQIWFEPHECGGLVHHGFQSALGEVWLDRNEKGEGRTGLKRYLDELSASKYRPIWFTGHSLGAALATLAANVYGNCQGVYTFGSPRVGDRIFKNKYKPTHFRFVNGNDIVTRVPPEGFYQHVGTLMFIDSNHLILNEAIPPACSEDNVDRVLDIIRVLKSDTLVEIPDWLLNHVPLLYSVNIWNNYAQLE